MEEFKQILPVSALAEDKKVAFYKKTYTYLAFSVLLFVVVEYLFLQSEFIVNIGLQMIQGWTWLIVLGLFMLATNYAEKMALKSNDKTTHHIALFLYVIAEAFIFVPLIFIALQYTAATGTDVLSQAGIMTLALFTGLSAIVLMTKKDFSFLGSILTIGTFLAIGLIVAGMLFGFHLGLWFSVGMVVLASGSILYQTSNMVHKYHEEQYVAASLGLFASLMLLFWYIISIFMSE
ncbi:modulator of FtsH protease YccA [Kordia sp. SMS9]|uniref:Bax inhibitor-1/YccA family protein n=1 Tax=Kordia sp. SMS9 TaxID=2282170 RepID=UPI000E0DC6F0|nr:Bax inhibitor-1 family protein [Kordia sp. SMS9]AXG71455.1 modulator of FtsH protease YccA [Kordia sp. SMS9]